ncbi:MULTISPECIES: hypothetical protein [unclassified Streptococcus]|nr:MULTISPECIES: hypothetical protein [unclassified Streptococcus]MCQ9212635.1 hypothetical protein [Streptococcus sp. B01]MCQ9213974.1 hypothetical protein [Streptococcus sp. O1]
MTKKLHWSFLACSLKTKRSSSSFPIFKGMIAAIEAINHYVNVIRFMKLESWDLYPSLFFVSTSQQLQSLRLLLVLGKELQAILKYGKAK